MQINRNRTYQAIESFGASGSWWSQYAGCWPEADRNRIAALLFDPDGGIGLSAYRYNLGAGSADSGKGNYWNEYRRAQSFETAPGVYDWGKDAGAMWFLQEVTRRGCQEVTLFCNSPLERLTLSGMGQLNPGTVSNITPDRYAEWAAYCCDVAEHFLALGVPVKYLSPINEPQWEWSTKNGQEGCHFEPEAICGVYKAFLEVLRQRPALAELELTGPEGGEWGKQTPQYVAAMLEDPAVRAHMSAIDCHSYWSDAASKTAFRRFADERFPEKRIRMSEWCEMVHGTDPGMDSAIVLAKCVQEDLTILNAAHWCTWVAVAPRGYHDGLIHAWQEEDGTVQIMPLKRLWAYGNYTRFLHPGYVRVDVTGAQELLPVAFEGLQDGRMQRVIILINESAAPRSASLEGCTEGFTALQVHETSDAHDLDKVYDGPVLPSVTLPGRSVVTLVLHA